jgi:HlyD family secretion protein
VSFSEKKKGESMKKKIIIAAGVVVVAIVLFVILSGSEETKATYATAEVQRGDIAILVTATGSLDAVNTVQVGSQVSGTISALYADFNDRVKKGQVVAQLDPTFLKAQVAQAQADLEKAQASAELSKKESERAALLYQKNMISESDRDLALTNYDLAVASVKSAQAALHRAETNLDYATIVSPIDGVVISRDVDVGQTVAASLQAPTLFTIAQDLSQMQVDASIDEADIGQIRDGERVLFTVDAYPDSTFEGKVSQIRLSPEIVQNVVTYNVIIGVSNPNLLLKPGMTANVTILVNQANNILKVPAAALRFHPAVQAGRASSQGAGQGARASGTQSANSGEAMGSALHSNNGRKPRVWILGPEDKPEPILVQTGISDGTSVEITSGDIKEGDRVIVGMEGTALSSNSQQVNPFVPQFRGRGR